MAKRVYKSLMVLALLIIGGVFFAFPYLMGTKTYPLAIVEGNSMYPNLQNGDLIVFREASSSVANGSIIVFIQGQTGISMLDSLIRPVVIHRVMNVIIQYDGIINYRTKGDNNQEDDPALVRETQILGTPIQIIPKVGLLFLFLRSSQGMIAVVGFITLVYLGNYETKIKGDHRKKDFVGKMVQMVLNKEISYELLRKLELSIMFADDLNMDELKDDCMKSIVEWVRGGGLDGKWRIECFECSICHSAAIKVNSSEGRSFSVCEGCDVRVSSPSLGGEIFFNVGSDPKRTLSASPRANLGNRSCNKLSRDEWRST